MKVLVQRVKHAHVSVKNREVSQINHGLLLLIGVGKDDETTDIEYLAKKVVHLRIFSSTGGFAVGEEDEQGRMNLNIHQVNGQILSIPQFTLYADTRKGNRPGFDKSAGPEMAKEYWNKFNTLLRENSIEVREGIFGSHMEVGLINDGPVTIWLDSKHR